MSLPEGGTRYRMKGKSSSELYRTYYGIVGEYQDSKHVITQVQFKTGQTEALITVITVRE